MDDQKYYVAKNATWSFHFNFAQFNRNDKFLKIAQKLSMSLSPLGSIMVIVANK